MTGMPVERESRRARKRRMERERQLQATGAATAMASPQLAIRDVFSPGDAGSPEPIADAGPQDECDFDSPEPSTGAPADVQPGSCHTAAEETASEQLAALQHELQEKDELLGALTAQLEEAANRLDRLHRAGADRGPRVSAPESEGSANHAEFVGPLAKLCSAWEDVQFTDQFDAIRSRLDDIFDAVTLTRLEESYSPVRAPEPVAGRQTDSASKLPGWEAMKAQLLREGAEHGRSQGDLGEGPAGVSDSAADVLGDLPLEPPAAVDLEEADRDLLAAAVEERDVFILHLIRRLRSGTSGRDAPINWSEISGAPEELRERLQEHEARLQELLRMEECDLSLERARLARERSRLEQLRRDLDRDARGGDRDGGDDSDRHERRWLRVFGFGRKEGAGIER